MTASGRVAELETFLRTRRHASGELMGHDGWDRWGSEHSSDEQRAEHAAAVADVSKRLADAEAGVTALVARLRVEDPAALEQWIRGKETVLREYAEACEAEGEPKSTEAFVARGELAEWAKVRAGEKPFVDENGFYVHIPEVRYRAVFGIDP